MAQTVIVSSEVRCIRRPKRILKENWNPKYSLFTLMLSDKQYRSIHCPHPHHQITGQLLSSGCETPQFIIHTPQYISDMELYRHCTLCTYFLGVYIYRYKYCSYLLQQWYQQTGDSNVQFKKLLQGIHWGNLLEC